MKRVLAGIAAGLIAAAGPAHGRSAEPTEARSDARMPPEKLADLVEGPMAAVEDGDLAAAEARLEALLKRRASDRLKVADTLMAFGVGLYERVMFEEGEAADQGMKRALAYIERSVPAYREALGPDHPELALALNTQADLMMVLDPEGPQPQAEALMQEVLRIRTRSLPPGHVETLMAVSNLASLKARSGRAGLAEAETLFSGAARTLAALPEPHPNDLLFLYEDWALAYAGAGQPARAVDVFMRGAKAVAEVAGRGADSIAFDVVTTANSLADTLEENGHAADAEALRQAFPFKLSIVDGEAY